MREMTKPSPLRRRDPKNAGFELRVNVRNVLVVDKAKFFFCCLEAASHPAQPVLVEGPAAYTDADIAAAFLEILPKIKQIADSLADN